MRFPLCLRSVASILALPALTIGLGEHAGAGDAGRIPETTRPAGTPATYEARNVKALDLAYDGRNGRKSDADILAFYADETTEGLDLRVDLASPGFPEAIREPLDNPKAAVTVLIDYADGGSTTLPDGTKAPIAWESGITMSRGHDGALKTRLLAGNAGESLNGATFAARGGMVEASLKGSSGFRAAVSRAAGLPSLAYGLVATKSADEDATPIRYYVYTTVDGAIEDDATATNAPVSPAGAHNVAFVQHGNQGLTYTTVFRGERGEAASYAGDPNNPDDGFDELIAAHEYYNLPINFHMASTLQTAAAWHDPAINAWLTTGVTNGWCQMVTSAFAQHIMPFFQYNMNSWSLDREKDMTDWRYGGNAVVAWVPERVWLDNPDSDGNGTTASAGVIDWPGTSFVNNGIQAVILDDYIHCGYENNAFDDHHIYTIGNGLKIIPIDNNFVGEVNYDWGSAWNRIINSTADELIVYGNDAEIAAEVSQGAGNASALNNYIKILELCSMNSGTVSVWKVNDTLGGFGGGSISLQNGTYGLLGGYGGYGGGNNGWYTHWAGYTGSSNLDGHAPKWNYGQIWDHAYNKVTSVPVNNISEGAWYVMMTNLHESGWHDGADISGWQHHYTNHIKNANAHSEAARWAAGLYASSTGAYLADFDDDGVDEAVIYNDRVLAVFESIGGKAQWVFAKGVDYNYSVVSNDNVYWVDTDGDYNETNHIAALSDVSVAGADRENDLYALSVVTGSGTTVEIKLTHASVEKRIRLTLGNPYLRVIYNTYGSRAYVKAGFTPDLVDMTWNGTMTRVWDPDGVSNNGGYFGWKNPRTNATGAIVVGGVAGVGGARAFHNLDFTLTLLGGDEFYGDGSFEVYLYAGFTSALDGMGHVPELKALRNSLVDVIGADAVRASEFPTPDRLSIRFNEPVKYNTIVKTGISFDDDNDGVADVTLTNAATVLSVADGVQIDFQLPAATAIALEALNPATTEIMFAAGAVTDVLNNPNVAITHLNNKPVTFEAATKLAIDGRIDPAEWPLETRIVNDPNDSQWTSANEIDALHMCWDETYLYLAIDGQVSGNSWILYLDTDWNGPNGQTNLTAINTWERGATFTGAGFKPDFEWGTYQHQGGSDSSTLWKILSATTTEDKTSLAVIAFDSQHTFGAQSGSEIAIPWDALYGLGNNACPPSTRIGVVASICWDPDPAAELGGDVAPNNPGMTALPVVGSSYHLYIDVDGNGVPDPGSEPTGTPESPLPIALRPVFSGASPNPFNPVTRIRYDIPSLDLAPGAGVPVRLTIFDVRGREVSRLVDGIREPGTYEALWDGRSAAGEALTSGIYFGRIETPGYPADTIKITMAK